VLANQIDNAPPAIALLDVSLIFTIVAHAPVYGRSRHA